MKKRKAKKKKKVGSREVWKQGRSLGEHLGVVLALFPQKIRAVKEKKIHLTHVMLILVFFS